MKSMRDEWGRFIACVEDMKMCAEVQWQYLRREDLGTEVSMGGHLQLIL
jgi:hypothetical protein